MSDARTIEGVGITPTVPTRNVGRRGETNRPTVAARVGNAWVAHQALGLPSPAALTKKFTRLKNPWPAEFRTRDNEQWIYDIEALRSWLFREAPVAAVSRRAPISQLGEVREG